LEGNRNSRAQFGHNLKGAMSKVKERLLYAVIGAVLVLVLALTGFGFLCVPLKFIALHLQSS
jgi:uncharacterized membrane protein